VRRRKRFARALTPSTSIPPIGKRRANIFTISGTFHRRSHGMPRLARSNGMIIPRL
jgi:hypothetical protein